MDVTPTTEELANIPALYSTEEIPFDEKMIYAHFAYFNNGKVTYWFVAEYAPEERLFFGFVLLNSWFDCAEWGYISFDELLIIPGIMNIKMEKPVSFKEMYEKFIKPIK